MGFGGLGKAFGGGGQAKPAQQGPVPGIGPSFGATEGGGFASQETIARNKAMNPQQRQQQIQQAKNYVGQLDWNRGGGMGPSMGALRGMMGGANQQMGQGRPFGISEPPRGGMRPQMGPSPLGARMGQPQNARRMRY